jgi:hypothetical protein
MKIGSGPAHSAPWELAWKVGKTSAFARFMFLESPESFEFRTIEGPTSRKGGEKWGTPFRVLPVGVQANSRFLAALGMTRRGAPGAFAAASIPNQPKTGLVWAPVRFPRAKALFLESALRGPERPLFHGAAGHLCRRQVPSYRQASVGLGPVPISLCCTRDPSARR